MELRGGTSSSPAASGQAADQAAGGAALTSLLLALWYASSIVNNQSSKVLVSLLGAEALTFTQLVAAAGCGALVLRGSSTSGPSRSPLHFDSLAQLADTAALAAAFLAGCYALNACLASMHVSLAMVLRSAEPLTTLAPMLLKQAGQHHTPGVR